jgi:hypothetical protein
VQVVRRVNFAIATCITAVSFALAGLQLGEWITKSQRPAAPADVVLELSIEVPVTDQSELSVGDTGDDRQEPFMDLYGNEVTSAVATYSLDPSGTVYEEHSPQTEVPRLGVPST